MSAGDSFRPLLPPPRRPPRFCSMFYGEEAGLALGALSEMCSKSLLKGFRLGGSEPLNPDSVRIDIPVVEFPSVPNVFELGINANSPGAHSSHTLVRYGSLAPRIRASWQLCRQRLRLLLPRLLAVQLSLPVT